MSVRYINKLFERDGSSRVGRACAGSNAADRDLENPALRAPDLRGRILTRFQEHPALQPTVQKPHPRQQGLFYARTDVGGAYRYNSATGVWIPLNDWTPADNPNLFRIDAIAINPNDASKLY